ncbi:2-oxoacid:acceptor oxidoreductase subunit alpha [Limnochorda pilosa]|uniref:2-oxoglutarate ferredoxin oxidoreductase subunit alpha n=1 Tax=Limnochorda pilosa TaxID=1555112 RepID=A0A0K2SQI3_LIMPI|nr:2-oxoacid:acceptor oxidoreductase subunit alpha [Limnochorda pilosa]BAS29393.1 2-oxoglutarate ferredoxin oxidoreductase subunit alpha [Limnochorda pilosa]
MAVHELSIKLAGEAGQGVESNGAGFARAAARAGLYVYTASDYMSRIRGGHNSYLLRISDQKARVHRDSVHLLLAFNPHAITAHLHEVVPGGAIIVDEGMRIPEDPVKAAGLQLFPLPLKDLAERVGGSKIMLNTAALGATAAVTGFDLAYVEGVIRDNFGSKKGAAVAEANLKVARAAYELAGDRYGRRFPWKLHAVEDAPRRYLLNGNQALAMGALAGGCRFISAYPMTPASSIFEWLTAHAQRFNVVSKQMEDEIAAVTMAIGAAYVGARAMTATSGGGFSLMVEALGLAGMAEVPLVVVDAQRPGPSTGMPTRSDQGDLLFVTHASQGEFPRLILAPGNVRQCFEAGYRAFNLAERYQTPVIVLTNGFLASSLETVDAQDLPFDEVRIDRGELLDAAALDGLEEPYARFRVTESGVSPRALPGHPKAVYTTPSDEHTEYGAFESEDVANRLQQQPKRMRKLEAARAEMNGPSLYGPGEADVTLVGWGSTLGALQEAVDELNRSRPGSANLLHFTDLWPFPASAEGALARARQLVVVEENQTGQFARLLRAETGRRPDHLITRIDGRAMTPDYILENLKEVALHVGSQAV